MYFAKFFQSRREKRIDAGELAARLRREAAPLAEDFARRFHSGRMGVSSVLENYVSQMLLSTALFLEGSTDVPGLGLRFPQNREETLADLRREFAIFREILYDLVRPGEILHIDAARLLGAVCEMALSRATDEFLRYSSNEVMHQRKAQLWLEDILRRVPSPLLLFDPKTRRAFFVNEAAKRGLGFDYTGNTSGSRVKVFDDAGLPLKPEMFPSARALRGEQLNGEEFSVDTPDGLRNIKVYTEQLDEKQGRPPAVLLLLHNITELKLTAAELERTRTELREMADSMPQIVWTATPDGKLDYLNRGWMDYCGTDFMANPAEAWAAAIHPEDLEPTQRRWNECVASGRHFENEFRLRAADGSFSWYMGRATPVLGANGRVRKWYGTNTNIHDLRVLRDEVPRGKRPAGAGDGQRGNRYVVPRS